ncbi:OmpH family outer membrane protein [Candidatus Providencia siddallii]|uniref:Chaperone protein Skp n=1 Tax=Candidatus Providencia siddallii TaxID=1715285 RepID=A0ABM9NNW7_9GAMM
MKKLFFQIIISIFLLTSKNIFAEKIAIVNINEIFKSMPDREIIVKQLEDEFQSRATELENLERDLRIHIKKLHRDGSSMKKFERKNLESELIAKRNQFTEKANKFEEDTKRRQTEERDKILHRIQETIKSIANKEGYDILIDANAIAYAKNNLDITNYIQKKIK